ncbi:MAG: rhomboid family intramembrane serine protease [Bacteroidales bacterium]|nr:rhomboid family intramembrane serine protease [Bacteroidales bacterium]
MNVFDDIRNSLRRGNILYRLIFVNILVFLVLGIFLVLLRLFTPGSSLAEIRIDFHNNVLKYLMVPSLPRELLLRPWTIVTYMFAHTNLWHIAFNLLILYWFGKIFLQYLTAKQMLSTYFIGGFAGALLYILFINVFPGLREYLGGSMLGASAAIMAIVIAIAFYVPDYTLHLLFIGPVKLKYIALAFVAIDILMIASDNAGGNIAHLGGAIYGYYFITQFRKGRDTGKWFNTAVDKTATLLKPRPKLNVSYRKHKTNVTDEEYNRRKIEEQREIDRILDKIAQGGYESLNKKEKETLFKMGNKK